MHARCEIIYAGTHSSNKQFRSHRHRITKVTATEFPDGAVPPHNTIWEAEEVLNGALNMAQRGQEDKGQYSISLSNCDHIFRLPVFPS